MKVLNYEKEITEACKQVGTYQDSFRPAISALSTILEERDRAYDNFLAAGAEPVVETVDGRGTAKLSKNPRLAIWLDLNNQALSYWRDLGLTPSGLKKINEKAIKDAPQKKTLEDVLSGIGL